MNDDHRDAVRLMAVHLGQAPDGDWRLLGCDPAGIDLAIADTDVAVRLDFPHRIKTPGEARSALIGLVDAARRASAA